jgi:hypothetical protein
MALCYGGGIKHTLSRAGCVRDEHHGAKEYFAEIDKHKPTCAWVLYEHEARCDCSTSDTATEPKL